MVSSGTMTSADPPFTPNEMPLVNLGRQPVLANWPLPIGASPIGAFPMGALPTTGVGGGGCRVGRSAATAALEKARLKVDTSTKRFMREAPELHNGIPSAVTLH